MRATNLSRAQLSILAFNNIFIKLIKVFKTEKYIFTKTFNFQSVAMKEEMFHDHVQSLKVLGCQRSHVCQVRARLLHLVFFMADLKLIWERNHNYRRIANFINFMSRALIYLLRAGQMRQNCRQLFCFLSESQELSFYQNVLRKIQSTRLQVTHLRHK